MSKKVPVQDRPTVEQVASNAGAFTEALGLTPDNSPAQPRGTPSDPLVSKLAVPAGAFTVAHEAPAPSSSDAPEEPQKAPGGNGGWADGMLALAGVGSNPASFATWMQGDSQASGVIKDSASLDWIGSAMYRAFTDPTFAYDPTYKLPEFDSEAYKELTHGVPEEYLDRFAGAQNADHARFIADRIREETAAEQRITEAGGAGIAARVVVNLADPVGIAIGAASGSLGFASKGTRIARALKAAGVAAGENAVIAGLANSTSETRDGWDTVHAAVGGMLWGGAFGLAFSKAERAAIRASEQPVADAVARAELSHELAHNPVVQAQLDNLLEQRASILSRQGAGGEHAELDAIDKELEGLARQQKAAMDAGDERFHASTLVREQVDAEARAQDATVFGDQIDSPKVAKKRAREVEASAQARVDALFGTPAAQRSKDEANLLAESAFRAKKGKAAAEGSLADIAGKIERLNQRRVQLADAVQAKNDLTAIDRQLAEVRSLRDAPVGTAPDAPEETPFGRDSASAARFTGEYKGTVEDHDYAEPFKNVPRMDKASLAKWYGNFAAILRGDEDEYVRGTVGLYVGDPVGSKAGEVVPEGASEVAAMYGKSALARFYSATEASYPKWLAEHGHSWAGGYQRAVRDEFMSEVGRYVRGEAGQYSESTRALGNQVRQHFAQFVHDLKAQQVKGFETLDVNPNYLPRVVKHEALAALERKYGTDSVVRLVAEAFHAKHADLYSPQVAERFARGWVRKMKELRVGDDANLMHGVSLDDEGTMLSLLEKAGVDHEERGRILAEIRQRREARGAGEGGSARYGKHRLDFDETFSMKLQNQAAREAGVIQYDTVRVSDMLDNNVENLVGRYTRSMSGHYGLAKAAGVRSLADHEARLKMLRSRVEASRGADEAKKVAEAADFAHKLVTGQPITDADALTRWGRFLRDYNFNTTMNQVGFAQVMDLGALLNTGYLRHTLKQLGTEDLFRAARGADGRYKSESLREIEEVLGLGTDFHNNAVFSSYAPPENTLLQKTAGAAEHAWRVLGRGTQLFSGLASITRFSQHLAARAIQQRIVNTVLGKAGKFDARRWADLGIDSGMSKRIEQQIAQHVAFVDNEVGGKVRVMNWSGWDDVDARDAVLHAVHKEARRIIQEEDLGDTAAWMHKPLWKLVTQFRRFGLVSYSKQLLHGVSHADAEVATAALMMSALGTISYTAQMELKTVGMSDEDAAKFRERWLSPAAIARAAVSRNNYVGLLPGVVDSVSGTLTGQMVFDNRASGLSGGFLSGIPAVSTVSNLADAIGAMSQATLRGDRQFTQRNAKSIQALLPFGNFPLVNSAVNLMIQDLPKKNEDHDSKKPEWFFE